MKLFSVTVYTDGTFALDVHNEGGPPDVKNVIEALRDMADYFERGGTYVLAP